jgi:hypothetical protein
MEKFIAPRPGEKGPNSPHLNRRDFLGRLAAGMAVVGVGAGTSAEANVARSPMPRPRPHSEGAAERLAQLKALTYAAYIQPRERALDYVDDIERDLLTVVDRMVALTADDEQFPAVTHVIDNELALTTIPEPIRATLKEMMLYVPYVESRFDPSAVSEVRAFGLMQLMPNAWQELSRAGEEQTNLVDQIRVAGRLLEQTYRHLMNTHQTTFLLVTDLLYDGDTDRCGREFIAPLIINGYFSGMGTMERVLDGFVNDYVTSDEKIVMSERGILTDEFGVYGLCATAAEVHRYSRLYGEESGRYVPKILAAKQVIRTGLPERMLTELIPGFVPRNGLE